jgi:hypothetical protein
MKTLKEILDQLRQTTEHSQPNIKYQETMNLINELDELLNSVSLAKENMSETLDGYEWENDKVEDLTSIQELPTTLNENTDPKIDKVEDPIPTPKRGRTKK